MNKQKKVYRILISLNNGWTIRNWIYTGILDKLEKRFEIMLLTPVKDNAKFYALLSKRGMNAKVSHLYILKTHPVIKTIRVIKDNLFNGINRVETQKIMKLEKQRSPFEKGVYIIILILSKVIWARNLIPLLEQLENYLNRKKIYKDILANFQPDIFITTHPFGETERNIIIAAHREKIPILASILSWDNVSNKGMLPLFLDKIIVWNHIQKNRILSYHPQYNSKHIAISGITHFDIYRSQEASNFNRQNYLESIKIDPEFKLLLYCTGPRSLFPKEPEIVDILIKNMEKGRIPDNTYLLVRCHPHDYFDRYAKFLIHERVKIFGSSLDKTSHDTFTWIPPEDEMHGLMAMLRASALCINIASTTSLDAAACGLPIINVVFDGYEDEKYSNSARRFYDFTHYQDVVKTGAAKMVSNEQELIHWINRYLEEPWLDQEKREELISEQCWKLDGESSERVAEVVSNFVNENTNK